MDNFSDTEISENEYSSDEDYQINFNQHKFDSSVEKLFMKLTKFERRNFSFESLIFEKVKFTDFKNYLQGILDLQRK